MNCFVVFKTLIHVPLVACLNRRRVLGTSRGSGIGWFGVFRLSPIGSTLFLLNVRLSSISFGFP